MKWPKRALFAGLVCALAAAAPAAAQHDEGTAKFTPWSGYWWPMKDGDLIKGPLTKYDQASGKKAADWESAHNGPNGAEEWYGYCHGWSAASVQEKEPVKQRSAMKVGGGDISLGIGDQKGLLTACHTQDLANIYGERNDGNGDPQDIYPDELWRVLKLYVKQQGVPIILDLDAGAPVWNYPVYAYRVDYQPSGDEYQGTMSIWMADDGVAPDYIGTKAAKSTYHFTFKMTPEGNVVAGSSKWVGPSVKDHPDFAWYPYVAVSENPEVDYTTVKKMVDAGSQGAPPPPVDPDNPPQPPEQGTGPDTPPTQSVIAISPVELLALVTNKTSDFDVDVKVDKFSGGEYTLGESFTVNVASEKDGYLYLFYLDTSGGLTLLFPQANQDNRIKKSDERITIPGPKDAFTFQTAGAPGTHRVRAIVTTRPLLLSGLTTQKPRFDNPTQSQGQGPAVQGKPQPPGTQGPKQQVQSFDLPPGQKQYQQQVVKQDLQKKEPVKPEQVGKVKVKDLLKEFGQGDVAFYVGPPDKPKKDKE